MPDDFSNLNTEDQLKAENEFLKMKLMLENGARFGKCGEDELPPEVENEFLNNIIEFEKQWENPARIKVFDKIGKPGHFMPVDKIPDEEIDKAWEELLDHLNQYGISLDACSPNITARELYRFTMEELFEYEMDDIDIPGMIHGFIYDEFHPDLVYDNTRTAVEDGVKLILCKEPIEWMNQFSKGSLRLNEHLVSSVEELKYIINQFKAAYDNLVLYEISRVDCVINNSECVVTGKYSLVTTVSNEAIPLSGNWKIVLRQDSEFSFWDITEMDLEGIKF